MHEVMFQSYILKKEKYIMKFGAIMEEIIHILIKSFGEELEFVNKLLKIIEFWEKRCIFKTIHRYFKKVSNYTKKENIMKMSQNYN